MKLAQLKQKVYEAWEFLNTYKGRVIQPENFQPEIQTLFDSLSLFSEDFMESREQPVVEIREALE